MSIEMPMWPDLLMPVRWFLCHQVCHSRMWRELELHQWLSPQIHSIMSSHRSHTWYATDLFWGTFAHYQWKKFNTYRSTWRKEQQASFKTLPFVRSSSSSAIRYSPNALTTLSSVICPLAMPVEVKFVTVEQFLRYLIACLKLFPGSRCLCRIPSKSAPSALLDP